MNQSPEADEIFIGLLDDLDGLDWGPGGTKRLGGLIGDLRESIRAGNGGDAVWTLCSALDDYDVDITPEFYSRIKNIALLYKLDWDGGDFIDDLVGGPLNTCPACGFHALLPDLNGEEFCRLCGWNTPPEFDGDLKESVARVQKRVLFVYPPSVQHAAGFSRDPEWEPDALEKPSPRAVSDAPSTDAGTSDDAKARVLALKAAVYRGDVDKMMRLIRLLDEGESEPEYDQIKEIRALLPEMAWALFGAGRLDDLVEIAKMDMFPSYDFYDAIEALSYSLETGFLLRLAAEIDFPYSRHDRPRGVRWHLTHRIDPEITSFLMEAIHSSGETNPLDGTSFSDHQKTFSQFQYIRPAPEGTDIVRAIEILYERDEPEILEFFAALIENPPWPTDTAPYTKLIEIAWQLPGDRMFEALKAALANNPDQYPVRRLILRVIFYRDPNLAARRLIGDLDKMPDHDRLDHVGLMETFLSRTQLREDIALDLIKTRTQLEQLDTRSWSWASRGAMKEIAQDHFPNSEVARHSGPLDRLAITSVLSFRAWRIDHMGCGIILPILFVAGWLVIKLCDWLFGTPTTLLGLLDNVMLAIWVLVVGGTATTHFSGHETIKDQLTMSVIFWLAALGFPIALAVVHIAAFMAKG